MVFVMEVKRGRIAKGLVWPPGIVFHEPFGKLLVKYFCVSGHVPHLDEFFFERSIEPFVVRIVFWGFHSGMVVGNPEARERLIKVLLELRPIVSLDVFNLSVKEIMQPVQEVSRRAGTVGRVHTGKGQFGIFVDGSHDVALPALVVSDHRIEAQEESSDLFPLQFRNLLSFDRALPFFVDPSLFLRVVVESTFLNNTLYLPRTHTSILRMPLSVQNQEFHLAIADMFFSEMYDPFVLNGRKRPLSSLLRSAGALFQASQVRLVEPF